MSFRDMRRVFYAALFLLLGYTASFGQTDSLRTEIEGDKVFVIHQVQSKQTLYSLARRYKTTVTEINKANPVLTSGLQVGQTLKIPFGGELPKEETTTKTITEELTHKVAAGETLFAIARKYDVNVSDLKQWNQMSSNSLSLGQELKIVTEKEVPLDEETTEVPASTEETPLIEDTESETVQDQDTAQVVEEAPEPQTYDGTPFRAVETEGIAEVIDEEEPSNKYFALHKTAKVGTVIKVKNLMNDLTVYVRVIGGIPDTSENENLVIKLNQKAYDHLKAIDKRFRVQLNYFQ